MFLLFLFILVRFFLFIFIFIFRLLCFAVSSNVFFWSFLICFVLRGHRRFRDLKSEYDALDCVVLGVSADDEVSHTNFIADLGLNFSLLADTTRWVHTTKKIQYTQHTQHTPHHATRRTHNTDFCIPFMRKYTARCSRD